MKKISVLDLALCALFAALSAVLSQLSIPIGPVPINLTHVSIFVSVGLLGTRYGVISQTVFVLLGTIGLPVFSGLSGGPSILAGPTGGFIIGYIGCAFLSGIIMTHFKYSILALPFAIYAGWLVTYVLGISWYMYSTNSNLLASLTVCMFPFLIGDLAKSILSVLLISQLRPIFLNKIVRTA